MAKKKKKRKAKKTKGRKSRKIIRSRKKSRRVKKTRKPKSKKRKKSRSKSRKVKPRKRNFKAPKILEDGDGKVSVEWDTEHFTVYDWKVDETPKGQHYWHIGGMNSKALSKFEQATGIKTGRN